MLDVGDFVFHRFNPDLGSGRVVRVDSRRWVVFFPRGDERLDFSANTDALIPIPLRSGLTARLDPSGELVTVAAGPRNDRCLLEDGREVEIKFLWPIPVVESAIDLLADGVVGNLHDFSNRVDALRLQRLREAEGLGSFLGGRIRLYPHQLYAAERACRKNPVRWLLADGVGLGKTVEACLIMNRLIHTGRAERILVVAPESLTVQWLGELWRKHHHVFVLLDDKRIAEVGQEQGEDFNCFEVHRRAIVSLERLSADPRLAEMALAAGIDLLVVDEAHHLQRPEGHPGNAAYRAVAPIAALDRNLLLLTATPLEDDALGFLRLLQLLRSDDLPEGEDLPARLESRRALPSCTSATRAVDIGGWPPRLPLPVDLGEEEWRPFRRLEDRMRSLPAENRATHGRKADLVLQAVSSSAALAAVLKGRDEELDAMVAEAGAKDPRLRWLVDQAPIWRRRGEKTLVFVARRESLEMVKAALERRAYLRVGLFHEELSTKRRDVEVAQLGLSTGPSILVSTECGGEGRNFQMCHRLVLFDMPWHPGVVEQRIGRLDRIGRDRPTEIVYFRPPAGLAGAVVRLYEEMGLFRESVGGLDRELRHIAREITRVAVEGLKEIDQGLFAEVLRKAEEAQTRVQEAAYHELHSEPYREEMAEGILGRIPEDLESLTAKVVLGTAARFGFEMEEQRGVRTWFIGLGGETLLDRLPGVPPEARFLGTFDREEAVARETLDFFASGHPLVEGVLQELHEGDRGRTACFEIDGEKELFGLLAIYKREGEMEAVVVDAGGRLRPGLATRLISSGSSFKSVDSRLWASVPGWSDAVRRMARALPEREPPQALAAFRVNPVK
ncbi:MAG: DEAD/DEAH box helicase family protein [Thermoanaerobaculales bacterium]|nr:DEAD/DEAH box helicase family protein [Thermoanaerobaculales bacterium]